MIPTTKDEKRQAATASNGNIEAYAAKEVGAPLIPYSYVPKPLGPMEVEVKVSHCGMCHTDLHLINNDVGITSYPIVPGHEIVGTVSQLGELVTQLQLGDRVGIGWLAGADFSCDQCLSGNDNLCESSQPTCLAHEGGFATHVRADSRLAYPIPDGLPSEYAAPLLCAGITVFAPLIRHRVSGNVRLGVVGIGGLGHLALQFGRALGCHVTAFSTSADKEEEAKKFGANEFVNTAESGALAAKANSCDFIMCTATADLPWADYINALRPGGKLCILGVPESEISVSALALIFGQKSVISSIIGSRSEMKAMLEFAARHQIVPLIEQHKLPDVNFALSRVAKNEVRYRAVLVME